MTFHLMVPVKAKIEKRNNQNVLDSKISVMSSNRKKKFFSE